MGSGVAVGGTFDTLSPPVGPGQSPDGGCEEDWGECVLRFIFINYTFDYIFLYYIFIIYYCDFIFKYYAALTHALFVLLIYWQMNGVVYILIVPTARMRRRSLCSTLC